MRRILDPRADPSAADAPSPRIVVPERLVLDEVAREVLLLALATTGLKMAMKGNGYGWEDGLMDLANAAVGGILSFYAEKIGVVGLVIDGAIRDVADPACRVGATVALSKVEKAIAHPKFLENRTPESVKDYARRLQSYRDQTAHTDRRPQTPVTPGS